MLLGPPKSKAGRRVVGVPDAIIPVLRDHLPVYVKPEPGALVLTGVKGGPLRRGNFSKMSAWPHAVASIGMAACISTTCATSLLYAPGRTPARGR